MLKCGVAVTQAREGASVPHRIQRVQSVGQSQPMPVGQCPTRLPFRLGLPSGCEERLVALARQSPTLLIQPLLEPGRLREGEAGRERTGIECRSPMPVAACNGAAKIFD